MSRTRRKNAVASTRPAPAPAPPAAPMPLPESALRGESGAKQIPVYLTEDQHYRLKVAAAVRRTTMSRLLLESWEALERGSIVTTHE